MCIRLLPLALSLLLVACGSNGGDAPIVTPPTATGSPSGEATTTPADAPQAAFHDALTRYETAARDYVAAIDSDAAAEALAARTDALVAIAAEALPEFLSRQPHCRGYLEAAMTLKDTWTTLSAEEIEAGYHKDGALPKIDNAAACYHFKDLIVHPITAQALLNEGDDNRAAARREIDEVIAHLVVVRATR